jgi:hypothetical protein
VSIFAIFKPRLPKLTPEEMSSTREYQDRLNRTGVLVLKGLTPVVGIGKAKLRRVFYLPGRVY